MTKSRVKRKQNTLREGVRRNCDWYSNPNSEFRYGLVFASKQASRFGQSRSVHQDEGERLMHVSVNGVRLFFDVEGAKFVPDGPDMREKPTLLMLHGGPGSDHSIYRPAYSALSDI